MYVGILKIEDYVANEIFLFWLHSDRNPLILASEVGRSAIGSTKVTYSMRLVKDDQLTYEERVDWMNGLEWIEE